jgi:hypothetical protein
MTYYLKGVLNNEERDYPYIYVLIKEEYLYIGETERRNYVRLSEHLTRQSNTGFLSKLIREDPEIGEKDDIPIKYFSLGIDDYFKKKIINNFSVKEFIRLIEAEIHIEIRKRRNDINNNFVLISDITRTNPLPSGKIIKLQSQNWYKELKENIYNEIIQFINEKNEQAPS